MTSRSRRSTQWLIAALVVMSGLVVGYNEHSLVWGVWIYMIGLAAVALLFWGLRSSTPRGLILLGSVVLGILAGIVVGHEKQSPLLGILVFTVGEIFAALVVGILSSWPAAERARDKTPHGATAGRQRTKAEIIALLEQRQQRAEEARGRHRNRILKRFGDEQPASDEFL